MPAFVSADSTTASEVIRSAHNRILECYDAAHTAEASGANITNLAQALNEAGALLDKAQSAYVSGNFDSSYSFAQQSQSKLDSFILQANELKTSALQQSSFNFWVYTVASAVGAIAILAVGFAVLIRTERKNSNTGETAVESSQA
jgi:hypothetical protein